MAQTCRECGAHVRWVTTHPGNKPVPVDAEACPSGTVRVFTDAQKNLRGEFVGEVPQLFPTDLYRPHRETCSSPLAWGSAP